LLIGNLIIDTLPILGHSPNLLRVKQHPDTRRDAWQAMGKGVRGYCPACAKGRMFRTYLKVNDLCPNCGEELFHHRADDAPPYLTILVVGHIVGSLMLLAEEFWSDAPIWLHMLIWPTLALVLSLWLLPIVKGGLIAYQWALRMHGFDSGEAPLAQGPGSPAA
jgi:uncharacterized protein (DUF983 family)